MDGRGYWVKIFDDGTTEVGTDSAIASKQASWSRGRLQDIVRVDLATRYNAATLQVGQTEWHQFDRFIATVQEGQLQSQLVYRAIQAKILPEFLGRYLISHDNMWTLVEHGGDLQITESLIGQWITLVMPVDKDPYITLSERGKIDH